MDWTFWRDLFSWTVQLGSMNLPNWIHQFTPFLLGPAPGSDIFPDPELKGLKVSGENFGTAGRGATTPTLELDLFTTSASGSLLSLKGFNASSKGFPGATGAEGTEIPPGLTFQGGEIHAKILGNNKENGVDITRLRRKSHKVHWNFTKKRTTINIFNIFNIFK